MKQYWAYSGDIQGTSGEASLRSRIVPLKLSGDTRGGQHHPLREGGLSGPLEDQAWRGEDPFGPGAKTEFAGLAACVWGVGGRGRARQDLREDLA